MIKIPTTEIKFPQAHADDLGFVFLWKGHFLRGIYPQAEALVRSYFESGFLAEVMQRNMFPKTWISEYENENFCMIIEHELITPVLYASEWNFSMLKDAAIMVLEIAKIAWNYNYNMIDCHKLNVLFNNGVPQFIDLGSFVPKKDGCHAWIPKLSFLSSYYYIIKVWSDGASQIAKDAMMPGIEFNHQDFYLYDSSLFRKCKRLLHFRIALMSKIHSISVSSENQISELTSSMSSIKGKCVKVGRKLVHTVTLSPIPMLNKLQRLTLRCKDPYRACHNTRSQKSHDLLNLLAKANVEGLSFTLIDNPYPYFASKIANVLRCPHVISIQQDGAISDNEYCYFKKEKVNITCVNFKLRKGSRFQRDKMPEKRLSSDMVVITRLPRYNNNFAATNILGYINDCLLYSTRKSIILFDEKSDISEYFMKEFNIEMFRGDSINCYMITKK